MNKLAVELNEALKGTSAAALFSTLATRMYFPRGIISQGGEAKKFASVANGTIGTTIIDGEPAILPSLHKSAPNLDARELVAYAPTAGLPAMRDAWKAQQIKKNPLLAKKTTSLPVVVPGLTAGISYVADLFIDEDKPLIASDPSWDNYELVCAARRGSPFHTFSMFSQNERGEDIFNIAGLEEAISEDCKEFGSARVILNFPQNPSGYSPRHDEVERIISILKTQADRGKKLLVISDDAYFGLNYEENIEKQSLFSYLCDASENILAVKIDGPTKEDFAWGFRCGFLTFGCKGWTDVHYEALTKKLMGVIRSSVSCSPTPSQSMILRSFQDPNNEAEKQAFFKVLKTRYDAVRAFVDTHKSSKIRALPFNSGYFMSFHTDTIDAEALREKLLYDKGIGTISIDKNTLRVAFSSIERDKIEEVYQAIYDTAQGM